MCLYFTEELRRFAQTSGLGCGIDITVGIDVTDAKATLKDNCRVLCVNEDNYVYNPTVPRREFYIWDRMTANSFKIGAGGKIPTGTPVSVLADLHFKRSNSKYKSAFGKQLSYRCK